MIFSEPSDLARKCPHERVQYCPLYVAGHAAGLPTCMGQWDYDGCDVDHGREDYGQLVAQLHRVAPDIIKERAEEEYRAASAEQRKRNMRAAGIH
jgi:hypothetical protein